MVTPLVSTSKFLIMASYSKYIIFCLLIIAIFPACQNEGYIGDLYGQWALKKSSVDAKVKEHDGLFFSFQGKVVWAKRVNYGSHTYGDVVGSFEHRGDSLIMKFVQQNEYTSPSSLIEGEFGFKDYENVRLLIRNVDASSLLLVSGDDYWQFEKY